MLIAPQSSRCLGLSKSPDSKTPPCATLFPLLARRRLVGKGRKDRLLRMVDAAANEKGGARNIASLECLYDVVATVHGALGKLRTHACDCAAELELHRNPRQRLQERLPDLEVREALGGRRFWLIACALLLVSTVTQGLVVHTVPLLTDKGYSPEAAATLMVAVGLSTMAGRLLSGYLVDRIFAPFVAASFFLLPCLGIYLLGSTISPVAGIISLGLASGTEIDMIGYLTSRYFGMKRFGQLYGYLFASFVVGSAVGPYMMGLAFERLHSYEPALWTFCAFRLFASGAILSLGPYRYPAEEKTLVGARRDVDAPATERA